jgi:inorganic triphosphatase YgiF
MSVETELKLRITSEHLSRLKCHPLLKKLSISRASTRQLYNIYYDTPDLKLHQREMALRLRRIGNQWLQTLKGGGGIQAGLHQRNEWEAPVAGEALDFDLLNKFADLPLSMVVQKKLMPMFITDFVRTTRLISFEGAEIELCFDSGEIRAGQVSCPISELELELKSGDALQLFTLALTLLDIVPLEIEHTSKAEYGYRLHSATKPKVNKANLPHFKNSTQVAFALQSIIGSCLLHLQANIYGVIHKLDDEYLHQMRVAMRRLRIVLAMTATLRSDNELSSLREYVSKLCRELGRLREWDVFVTHTLAPICESLPGQTGLEKLILASEKIRFKHYEIVVNRLRSQEYQRFLLRFGAWMQGDYWRGLSIEKLSLRAVATKNIEKRTRQVNKRGKHFPRIEVEQLHDLRIACKKLRYSTEFFGSLFNRAKISQSIIALAALQDSLGDLNDIAVAHRLLDELDTRALKKSIALIRGFVEHDRLVKLDELELAWKTFSTLKIK